MLADTISDILSQTGQTIKSMVKLATQSRRASIRSIDRNSHALIIMGNGPSLAKNIAEDLDILQHNDTLAVNFAGNTTEFISIKPKYYVLMDPHFFDLPSTNTNVGKLYQRLNEVVDWDMTLFIPANRNPSILGISNHHIKFESFNPVGVEGFNWLIKAAIDTKRGMPRPRNVLIPSIMIGIWLGYKEIYLLGADHSWLRTLDVDENNTVISIQPHFYTDGEEEHRRVATLFRDTKLHELLWGFYLAFKGYHPIRSYADTKGTHIYNSTPGSYIDAFERRDIKHMNENNLIK